MKGYAYIGCRTSTLRGARGKGIEVYRLDSPERWSHIQTVCPEQENPSWLALNHDNSRLYAVHGDGDRVSVYARDAVTGKLRFLSSQTTGPANPHPDLDPQRRNNPVHVVLDPAGEYVLIANLDAGNIAVLPVTGPDELAAPSALIAMPGRQAGTHAFPGLSRPHEVIFDAAGRHIAVPVQGRPAGNGTDMIRVYAYHRGECRLTDEVPLPAGSWPRHGDFHPNQRFFYGFSELSCAVTVFDYHGDTGKLTLKQTISSLPPGETAHSDASEIEVHPSGKFLYAANRGHDSIAVFAVDPQSGCLTSRGWVPCGGKTPRFTCFSPDGGYLYCANEDSDAIQTFAVDAVSGMLSAVGSPIPTASPTCICLVK